MSPQCQAFRDELLAAGLPATGSPVAAAAPLWAHAGECAACAAWARGATRVARQLEALPRPALPAELEGRVVASLQAGYRQARAAQALAALGRVTSPAELDEAVDAEFEEALREEIAPGGEDAGAAEAVDEEALSAEEGGWERLSVPGVLERLVAEELAAPSQARARRYLGSLRRRRAPEELRMRVGLILADRGGDSLAARRPAAFGLRTVAGLLAAALLIAIGSLVLRPRSQPPRPALVIERVTDSSDLPPLAASLFDGVSGGLLSVEEG
jgi:hypothetical protein